MSTLPTVGAGTRDDARYAEACGRIRALEKRLLGPARLEELLNTPDLPTLLQTLVRFEALASAAGAPAADWEGALDRAGARSDRLLLAIDPHPAVSRILVLRADIFNLAALLRARALGVAYPGPWHARSLFRRPQLEAMVRAGDYAQWPEPVAPRLAALHALEPEAGLPAIDEALEAAWRAGLLAEARRSGSRFFADWLGHAADLGNIRAYLRRAAAPDAWPRPPALLPGGHLGAEVFEPAAFAPAVAALILRLERTVYAPVIARAGDGAGGVSLAAFERASDDFLTRLLRPARYLSLGPEPLWAWHIGLGIDAKNVRALVLGRRAGLATEALRTLMRLPHGA